MGCGQKVWKPLPKETVTCANKMMGRYVLSNIALRAKQTIYKLPKISIDGKNS